ncbi:phosphatase PAP2 family protein [Salinicola endophyticus]|uniref:undecaprenyl-diphosphate phosphatase n=1 Tax=Salinicola endophyticus TaxID=1949083 RepID=A0ABY8FLP9_9GAMM|nr:MULTISPECIES: phosphatase PAP2 family protein [Salinicola]WFF42975.1 phosphatase PAP2 family protein [Salinicola endophyticus]
MLPRTTRLTFERLDRFESRLSHRFAELSRHSPTLWLFRLVSRVGDWPAWVLLCLCQPLWHGTRGWLIAVYWGLTTAVAALLYRLLKTRLCRERPYITFSTIRCSMPPVDRYSFPSGHTLHAVMFTLLTATTTPSLLPVVFPLACLIAASRVVLGLHYLSDVLIGGLIGAGLAWSSQALAALIFPPL